MTGSATDIRLRTSRATAVCILSLGFGLGGCSDGSDNNSLSASCGELAARALQICISSVNTAQSACYDDDGSSCDEDNADILDAQDTLQNTLQNSCSDGEFLGLSQEAVVGRFQNACHSQPDSIAWRTFGGPQGAVLPTATDEQRTCLLRGCSTTAASCEEI